MKQFISCIALAALLFLATGKSFAQTIEKENSAATVHNQQTASPQYVKGITAGRARALVGVAIGLTSLIVGWRAKAVSSKLNGTGRTGALLALSLGLTSIVLSIIHLWTSAGAVFGSGSGKAGAIFAILVSVVGLALAGLTLRSKTA